MSAGGTGLPAKESPAACAVEPSATPNVEMGR
jgi:hypothetical protein